MPPSELTPNYRADNNRGAQSCAAVCSRRKSGCRIAGCHAPFCRPRYYSPRSALSFNPSPPLSLGVARLSKTFNDNSPLHPYTSVQTLRHFIPFHSVRVSRDRLRRRSIYVTGNETRYRWSRERMLLEKEFEPARVKRILFVFSFSSYTPWDC